MKELLKEKLTNMLENLVRFIVLMTPVMLWAFGIYITEFIK